MLSLPIRRPRTDLTERLRDLLDRPGPFLTVYLDVSPGEPRRTARERLVEAGRGFGPDSAPAIDRAAALLDEVGDGDALFAAIVDHEGTAVWSGYPDPPRRDLVTIDPLPRLGPLLESEQALCHHLIVTVGNGRVGIVVVPRHGAATEALHEAVDHRSTAALVQIACRASQTRLVILCGADDDLDTLTPMVQVGLDIDTAVTEVRTDRVSEAGGSAIMPDTDVRAVADAVVRAVADHGARQTVDLLRWWRFHRSHGATEEGVDDSLRALASGRARLVLLHDDPEDRRLAWFGEDGTRLAPDLEHAAPIAPDEGLRQARLPDVVIRGALISGCGIHLVPNVDVLPDGIGVVLDDHDGMESLGRLFGD